MSTPNTFVITGTSDIYQGIHCLNIYGGMHPIGGKAVGRISPDRVAEMRRFFASPAEAQVEIDHIHAHAAAHNAGLLWTYTIQPETAVA